MQEESLCAAVEPPTYIDHHRIWRFGRRRSSISDVIAMASSDWSVSWLAGELTLQPAMLSQGFFVRRI